MGFNLDRPSIRLKIIHYLILISLAWKTICLSTAPRTKYAFVAAGDDLSKRTLASAALGKWPQDSLHFHLRKSDNCICGSRRRPIGCVVFEGCGHRNILTFGFDLRLLSWPCTLLETIVVVISAIFRTVVDQGQTNEEYIILQDR